MAYIAPIHRSSSVRYALKLNFLNAEEECLVVAKANRLEIWLQSSEGLTLAHSKSIYGQISMLQRIRPTNSSTDHLFIGTERFQYFTAAWNPETRQLDTVQTFVDVSEKHMRDSQSLDRCLVDPTGKYMIMELFEGVLNLVKVLKHRKGLTEYLDEPEQVRISELFIRSSTFLYTESKRPKVALLWKDGQERVRLATYRVTDEKGQYSQFNMHKDRENELDNLDPGSTLLVPVQKGEEEQKRYIYRNAISAKAQLGGLIVVGETKLLYLDDESKATVEYALDVASIFVAWEMYDNLRYLLADDYGWLYLLTLVVDGAVVTGMDVTKLGEISKPAAMVYLGSEMLYVGSHEGDSQVIQLDVMGLSCEVLQVLPNIAPILDFTVMDMGSRDGDSQSNEYSTGQARLVTGSGAFKTGSLRSVRSGVGLEDIGILGDMENIRALFPLYTGSSCSRLVDTLIVSFLTETRIFQFDGLGEVEEVEKLMGIYLSEQTLLIANISRNRILQITNSRIILLDTLKSIELASWSPDPGRSITAAAANGSFALVSADGKSLISFDLSVDNLSIVAQQNIGSDEQIACIYVPAQRNVGLVGFWQSGSVSILDLTNLEVIHGEIVRTDDSAAVPRSIILAQILPPAVSGPTLLVAMSDGNVLTFVVDEMTYALSGKKSVILGIQHANFEVIPRADGISNVFATCEHSSLIYGSEGRIVYSAVTAEDATCICSFNSEAYPDAVVIASASEVKLSQIDTERRTHVRTLHVGETVRRIAYSAIEKAFGIGCIKRDLIHGEEIVTSTFRLVDEVAFGELGEPFTFESGDVTETVESVIRAELQDAHGSLVERFIVGTGFLDERPKDQVRGKIRVFGLNKDRSPYEILSHGLKGTCRCLTMLDGKIVAALTKTVVMFEYTERSSTSAELNHIASYRTSTLPIDIAVKDNIILVADLMRSMSVLEYISGKDGVPDQLVEVARHYQSCWATAVCHIEDQSYLECDAESNICVLRRNVEGITLEDRHKLDVTSEINLGEMVNRVRTINVETTPNAIVVPKAFLGTVEGSIYLFATIVQSSQDLLIRLQTRMADALNSPGDLSFATYRAFYSMERRTEEPFRFVDGELIERFLDLGEEAQVEICKGLGPGVEDIRNLVEELKRLH